MGKLVTCYTSVKATKEDLYDTKFAFTIFVTIVHVSCKCILINWCTYYVHKGRCGCCSLINGVSSGKTIVKRLGYCLKAISNSVHEIHYALRACISFLCSGWEPGCTSKWNPPLEIPGYATLTDWMLCLY